MTDAPRPDQPESGDQSGENPWTPPTSDPLDVSGAQPPSTHGTGSDPAYEPPPLHEPPAPHETPSSTGTGSTPPSYEPPPAYQPPATETPAYQPPAYGETPMPPAPPAGYPPAGGYQTASDPAGYPSTPAAPSPPPGGPAAPIPGARPAGRGGLNDFVEGLGGQANMMGILSAGLGLLSVVCCICTSFGGGGAYFFTLILAVPAVGLGIRHLLQVKAGQATNPNLAYLGIALGALGLFIAICGGLSPLGRDLHNDVR